MEKTLSVKEVAEMLKFKPRTIRNFIKRGYLKANKFSKSYRISEESYSKLITFGTEKKDWNNIKKA